LTGGANCADGGDGPSGPVEAMAKSASTFPTLTTRRLRLRRFEPRDAAGLHVCFGDPDAMRFWNTPVCSDIADTKRSLAWLSKTTSPYDRLAWAICRKTDDECIGMVNYHHRDARNRRLELGYIIAPRLQRKGLGLEAVRKALDYCTGELGAHRVEALIHPGNVASVRLVERLGFRCEGGPLADYWRVGDRYVSVMIYALITCKV
jgi:ribosomal-protein-alanine N-acetyltransferase